MNRHFNAKNRWKAIGRAIGWARDAEFGRPVEEELAAQMHGTEVLHDEFPHHPLPKINHEFGMLEVPQEGDGSSSFRGDQPALDRDLSEVDMQHLVAHQEALRLSRRDSQAEAAESERKAMEAEAAALKATLRSTKSAARLEIERSIAEAKAEEEAAAAKAAESDAATKLQAAARAKAARTEASARSEQQASE